MKKAKLIMSVLRTIIGVSILGAGIGCAYLGISWQDWCPNNDAGVIIVLAVYLISLIFIMCGIYEISPIFWKLVQPQIFRILFGRNTVIDWEEYEEELEELRECYIW